MTRGFTLIEIMIGIALVGTLAAVAGRNLDCLKKQAEDTEAKVEISAAMSAEKIHFSAYDTYTACLKQIGYRPRPDRTFTIGFSNKTVTTGQPHCGKPTDPTYIPASEYPPYYRKNSTLNCNTWGNKATNICNDADAPINSPDSASDINFAANTSQSDSIPISFANMNTLDIPCKRAVRTDPEGRQRYDGCWGDVRNYFIVITAFRGRRNGNQTYLSGFMSGSVGGGFEKYEDIPAANQ